MINPLIAALEELPGGLASTIPRLSPNVTQIVFVGTGYTIAVLDGYALFVDQFDPFPDSLPLEIRGTIVTTAAAADMTTLQVRVAFATAENPALNGEVVVTQPVQADGTFAVNATLLFRSAVPRPHRVTSAVTIEGAAATATTDRGRIVIDNANLSWFLDFVDTAERLTIVSSPLEFIARVRKSFLTSGDFDKVLTRFPSVTALLVKDSPMGKRLRAGHHMRHGADTITISHVLIGLEGGRLQDPRPAVPVKRPDTLLTWAGDLGGPLVRHLIATYYRNTPPTHTFDEFIAETASRSDLIGDIDGCNLAFSYDPARSLADNLRAYYAGPGRRRYSTFLAVTETNDGARALAREPGGGAPRLTAASKQFLGEQILDATTGPMVRRTLIDNETPREIWRRVLLAPPPEVEAALRVNSPEVQKLTGIFVTLIEQGLASEPP